MPDLVAARRHIEAALTALADNDAPEHFDAYRAHLTREEGVRQHAYQDHLGYWTIGVGRLVDRRKGGRLSAEEIDMLLANDIRRVITGMETDAAIGPAWRRVRDNRARATALVSMAFQMGIKGLAGFTRTLARLTAGDFAGAAASARASDWATQTPARARRVTAMIETGEME